MKAISLWQPYASFMAIGLKQNETRSWATKFRGDLAICSAKRGMKPNEFGYGVNALMHEHIKKIAPTGQFPMGMVLCVVEVYDCLSSAEIESRNRTGQADQIFIGDDESMLGDYSEGRFAWLTRNVRRLKTPIPVTGKQGFFNLPENVEKAVKLQLK